MRGFAARARGAVAIAAIAAIAACGDLFHGTDWPSKCDAMPDAEGCPSTASAGGVHGTGGSAGARGGTAGGGGATGGGGAAPCEPGKKRCGAACVDTESDPKHCGSCDVACDPHVACAAKQCAPYASCKAIQAAYPNAASGVFSIDPDGAGPLAPVDVYCDMTTQGGGWTLVLKLSADQFCYGSTRWTDGAPFNAASTLDPTPPAPNTLDAKSAAFDQLGDAAQLLFVTTTASVTTSFFSPSSPRVLMTTSTVPFVAYPDRNAWRTAFGHDRNQAPIFMRGGVAETTGNLCRTNPAATPSGCGQLCMFCYQAADGDCCGCDATGNDTNSGVGNNLAYCGGGVANCSTGGAFSNPNEVTLVWAR